MKDEGSIGKGIATVGIWAGVGVVGMYAGGAAIFVALFAMFATAIVWNR